MVEQVLEQETGVEQSETPQTLPPRGWRWTLAGGMLFALLPLQLIVGVPLIIVATRQPVKDTGSPTWNFEPFEAKHGVVRPRRQILEQ